MARGVPVRLDDCTNARQLANDGKRGGEDVLALMPCLVTERNE